MSLICVKRTDKEVIVSADSLCADDNGMIFTNNAKKIEIINDDLIIGSCGSSDVKDFFFEYVKEKWGEDEQSLQIVPLLRFMNDFMKEVDEIGIKTEAQSFLFVTKDKTMGIFYTKDDNVFSYDIDVDGDTYALGTPKIYARALLNVGMNPEEAIKETAKKYTCINTNVRTCVLER